MQRVLVQLFEHWSIKGLGSLNRKSESIFNTLEKFCKRELLINNIMSVTTDAVSAIKLFAASNRTVLGI